MLQSLNPLPYVAMWANCVAWLVYAFLIRDPYVLASNVPGVLIASYMAISCYGFAEDKVGLTVCHMLMYHQAKLSQSSRYSPCSLYEVVCVVRQPITNSCLEHSAQHQQLPFST